MHRDRYRFGSLLAAGVLLMTAACGDQEPTAPTEEAGLTGGWSTAGCELIRVPEHVTVAGHTVPSTPAKLAEVMAGIDEAGRARFADSFSGLEVDQAQVRAVVHRVPSAAFDDFIRRAAEDTCIVVRDAPHSAVDLDYWHDRVLADLAYWTHQGIRIVTVGARHDGAGVEVGTRDLVRANKELPQRYGDRAPLLISEELPVQPLRSPTAP